MSAFTFKVESFRRIEHPLDRTRRHCHIAVVEAQQLPVDLQDWRRVNLRDVNLKTAAAKEMLDTIATEPDQFLFRNRGIVIMARSASFDNKDNTLTLMLDNPRTHGIVDGGHTYGCLRHAIESTDPEAKRRPTHVRLEILTGFTDLDEVMDIVEGRNTGTAVSTETTMNMHGLFDKVQQTLVGQPYANLIGYRQFQTVDDEKCPITIKDILAYLICFDMDEYDDERHPHQIYNSKRWVFEYFKEHHDRLSKFLPLLPDILELRDTIYFELPKKYNGNKWKFASVDGVTGGTDPKASKNIDLYFTGQTSEYRIPNSYILPILAAFRCMVEKRGKGYAWVNDDHPVDAWSVSKERLTKRFRDLVTAKDFQGPNRSCRNPETWRTMYDTLQLALLQAK